MVSYSQRNLSQNFITTRSFNMRQRNFEISERLCRTKTHARTQHWWLKNVQNLFMHLCFHCAWRNHKKYANPAKKIWTAVNLTLNGTTVENLLKWVIRNILYDFSCTELSYSNLISEGPAFHRSTNRMCTHSAHNFVWSMINHFEANCEEIWSTCLENKYFAGAFNCHKTGPRNTPVTDSKGPEMIDQKWLREYRRKYTRVGYFAYWWQVVR